jgi:hypothetical protein
MRTLLRCNVLRGAGIQAARFASVARDATLSSGIVGLACLLATSVGLAETRTASLAELFELAASEQVAVPEADLTVELVRLSYRRCPVKLCLLPDGPVAEVRVSKISTGEELSHGELRRAPPSGFPYFVLPGDSDGETYARFSVHGAVTWCETRASRTEKRDCWSRLATLTKDAKFCARIEAMGLPAADCNRRVADALKQADPAGPPAGERSAASAKAGSTEP